LYEGAERFASRIEKESEGQISVKLVPAGALGGMESNLEALSLGSIDITYVGESYTSRYYGPMGVTAAPYAFQGLDHFKNYVGSDLYLEFKEGFSEATGHQIVGTFTTGFRNVTANRPIRKPEDMKGLKIRVPDAPLFTAMPKATGASPTPIAFSEVYLALEQGVVDAEENPLETIYNMKFHEVQKYINLTKHMMEPAHFIVSKSLWQKLSDKQRQLFLSIGADVSGEVTNVADDRNNELLSIFEKEGNIVVYDVDIAAFAEATYAFDTEPERAWTREQFDRLKALNQ
jgi:tripartite ATP-independent transporter DctP family solute receptor